jgi:glycine cleavage system H protein
MRLTGSLLSRSDFMEWNGFTFPDDLYYDEKHTWGRVEGDYIVQGMTDFGQKIAKEIIFVGFPRLGRQLKQGDSYVSVESGKWVGHILAPVSGKVTEVNEDLEIDASPINYSPYQEGWLTRIAIANPAELDHLMRAGSAEYEAFLAQEREKYASLLGL